MCLSLMVGMSVAATGRQALLQATRSLRPLAKRDDLFHRSVGSCGRAAILGFFGQRYCSCDDRRIVVRAMVLFAGRGQFAAMRT